MKINSLLTCLSRRGKKTVINIKGKVSFIGHFIVECFNLDGHNECSFTLLPNAIDKCAKKRAKRTKNRKSEMNFLFLAS